VERVFVGRGSTFVVNAESSPFFPCFVSVMLSSVTTELAVAAFLGSLGCISAGSIAGCLGFSADLFVCVKSGLAQLLYRKSGSLAVAQLLMSMQNHCVLNEWGSNIITHLFALTLGLSPALEELLLFAWGLAFSLFETILSTPSICFCFCQTMFSFYSN
jgi:hypothetical protein